MVKLTISPDTNIELDIRKLVATMQNLVKENVGSYSQNLSNYFLKTDIQQLVDEATDFIEDDNLDLDFYEDYLLRIIHNCSTVNTLIQATKDCIKKQAADKEQLEHKKEKLNESLTEKILRAKVMINERELEEYDYSKHQQKINEWRETIGILLKKLNRTHLGDSREIDTLQSNISNEVREVVEKAIIALDNSVVTEKLAIFLKFKSFFLHYALIELLPFVIKGKVICHETEFSAPLLSYLELGSQIRDKVIPLVQADVDMLKKELQQNKAKKLVVYLDALDNDIKELR